MEKFASTKKDLKRPEVMLKDYEERYQCERKKRLDTILASSKARKDKDASRVEQAKKFLVYEILESVKKKTNNR